MSLIYTSTCNSHLVYNRIMLKISTAVSKGLVWLRSIPLKTWKYIALAFVVIIMPGLLFASLADEVHENETLGFDSAVLKSVHNEASPMVDTAMKTLTEFGGPMLLPAIAVGLTIFLMYRRRFRHAFIVFISVGGASALNIVLKSIFRRDRPQLWQWIVSENGTSFPSGHAMASSALALSLIVILWNTKWRWLAVTLGLVYMLAIAFSRIYLGVHYPTDIIASWLVSVAWVSAVTWIAFGYNKNKNVAKKQ